MKKTHKVLLVLLGVIVLAVAVFKAMQPKEPEYQGRKLTEWIADMGGLWPCSNEIRTTMREASHVFLPFIEKSLLEGKSPNDWTTFDALLFRIQYKTGFGLSRSQLVQWKGAFNAFESFGEDSLPILERLLLQKHTSQEAAEILARLNAVEILRKGADPNQISPTKEHSIAGLGKVTQRKDEAVEVLLQLTQNNKKNIVTSAIYSLGSLAAVPDKVVPRLCELVKSQNEYVQLQAIHALAEFGTNAAIAVPMLLEIKSTSKDPIIRNAADNSANKIRGKWTP